MSGAQEQVDAAAVALRRWLGSHQPEAAIVLGSGAGGFGERLMHARRISYCELPGFPAPTVAGHAGEMIAGTVAGRAVLAQSGRFHLYEGHDPAVCGLAVRVFAELGIGVVVLTNAAGAIRRTFRTGSLMLIADHVNLTFRNPLIGRTLRGESRFPDMSEPYDGALRRSAREVARERGLPLDEGVYAGLLGPSFETPAEIRMLERLGVDAVGLSTVTEVIVARARGLRCLGMSTITNQAAGISPTTLSHVDVMEVGARVQETLGTLLEGVIARL